LRYVANHSRRFEVFRPAGATCCTDGVKFRCYTSSEAVDDRTAGVRGTPFRVSTTSSSLPWSCVSEDTRHDKLYVASSLCRRRQCGSSGLSILTFRSPTIIMWSVVTKHHQTIQQIRQLSEEAGVGGSRTRKLDQQHTARRAAGRHASTDVLE